MSEAVGELVEPGLARTRPPAAPRRRVRRGPERLVAYGFVAPNLLLLPHVGGDHGRGSRATGPVCRRAQIRLVPTSEYDVVPVTYQRERRCLPDAGP